MLVARLPMCVVVDPQPPLLPARVPAAHAATRLVLVLVVPLPVSDTRLPVVCIVMLHVLDAVLLSRYWP